jgi:hypothetical protein
VAATFALLDFVYARYTIAAAERKALKASLWAAVIPVLGGFVAIQYVDNHWLLIPTAVGAFVGTYIATRKTKETENAQS